MVYTLIFKAARQHLQRTTTTQWLVVQPWKGTRTPAHLDTRTRTHLLNLLLQRRTAAVARVGGCTWLHAQRRDLSLDCSRRDQSRPQRDAGKVSVSRHMGGVKPSTAQKVKDAGRDFTYLIVVIIGLGVTGGLLYVVFQELFSTSSPNKVYGKAFDKLKSNPEVIGAFGEPIKCYGETTRRQRRQHVSHSEFLKDGLKHMRLKFYIEGSEPGVKGTVHSESKENIETGKYEFRYIFVDVDAYPRRTIIVEDNR